MIILVKAGAPVDATIAGLSEHMEPGDIIIDGGNEWYENTERRQKALEAKGLLYLGMGVSGGEEGARNGPAMMPGGDRAAFDYIEEVVTKVCAQTDSGRASRTSARGVRATSSRWCTTASSTATCSSSPRRTTCFAWWAA